MRGLALGLAFAALVIASSAGACVHGSEPRSPETDPLVLQKRNEVTALWTQIREFRKDASMPLDPPPGYENQFKKVSVHDARRVCADGFTVPKACNDVCNTSDAICDNAEAICGLADELARMLGRADKFAQDKCTSAKASCRESKERCCECSRNPPQPEPVP